LAFQIPVSEGLISRWERAYKQGGRQWKPDRQALERLLEIFAEYLTPVEAQNWAAMVGYRLSQTELQTLFPNQTTQIETAAMPLSRFRSTLSLLIGPQQQLFGVEATRQQAQIALEQAEAPWLIALNGIGGIGKTSLANDLLYQMLSTARFYGLAWVSAKQEEFVPNLGLQVLDKPALNADTLTDTLLAQLSPEETLPASPTEKQALLTDLLKTQPYLIVIDNLETAADYEALLPYLRQLAQPGKFLLTSRHSLAAYADVFNLALPELSQADTVAFLRYEAETRGIAPLTQATQTQLTHIYEVVGGNPLALKLVVGQIGLVPLTQVLESLQQAQGKTVDALYTYIYWQAWQQLDSISRQLFLLMPVNPNGTFTQLAAVSGLDVDILQAALKQLIRLSLLEVQGDIESPRYRLHRLTETFLLTEVLKWPASP
jgi:hypothetical protein